MKLNTAALRYLTSEDWRVLAAVEQGSKNHEVVPTPLITQIAGLRGGSGVHKCISSLTKVGLIAKVKNAKYDGYRLTYGGLDYLALNTHRRSSILYSLGNQIGVGKESDIYITASSTGRQQVLKLHRLGRISFRSVKANRDYLRNRSTGSWLYLSRLAAQKEFAVMKVLWREGFAVPEPIAWSRHTVVMEFFDAFPLRMVEGVPVEKVGGLYAELMDVIVRLAQRGLIHGDFNEFNILIKEEEHASTTSETASATPNTNITLRPILIDFPQTISTSHANAAMYFDRDVACIKRYFERRFKYTSDEEGPFFRDAVKGYEKLAREERLDVEVEASGFSRKMGRELERFVEPKLPGGDEDGRGEEGDGGEDSEDEEDEVEEVDIGLREDGEQAEDPQVDDPKLAEEIGGLSLGECEDLAVKPVGAADFGLMPIELDHDPDVVSEKVHTKKKAAGWAI
ncbi:Serine/threonine-protein kinase rio2 [Vermiconidia calcicola]|uniref:Serine/threonine-protein kinase rio2 n=1 Tax=Vermiconidia calcicola TaxID=1690605 RepID=A0ACC3MBN2_9PEZI|nr:Serine/threonine-protein kinase rio2 [Vermiconidia calcicola]